ncbi:MAG: hypothetical protein SFU27_03880 [Thermonemataceae bacterium]|nr:hypothetical protein [Thermonemataceae bacterium]
MRKIIITFFVLVSIIQTKAQLQEYARWQQPIPKKLEQSFEVLPLIKDKKVIIFGEKEIEKNDTKLNAVYFKVLDSNLRVQTEKEYILEKKWNFEDYYSDSTNLYLIFYNNNYRNFTILTFNQTDIELRTAEVPFTFTPTSFWVFGNNAFIIGRHRGKDVMLDFSFFDNTLKAIPSFFDDKYDIRNIEINKEENYANVIIQELKRGEKKFFVRRLQSNGKQISENEFLFDKSKYPTDLESFTFNNEHYLLGLYGNGQSHFYSQGWIWAKYNPENPKTPYISQQSFDYLQHFFEYFSSPRRAKKERDKAWKKREEGKNYTYKLRFRMQRPQVYKNQLLLTAESFTMAYQYNGSLNNPTSLTNAELMRYPYYARPWGTAANPTAMPTYQFAHSITMAFDFSGNLLWDNALKIQETSKIDLEPNVLIAPKNNYILMLQCYQKGINLKVINQNNTIFEDKKIPYQKYYESYPQKEAKINPKTNKTYNWYDDYILISGDFNPNGDKIFNRVEDVFYVAKLKFIKPEKSKNNENK